MSLTCYHQYALACAAPEPTAGARCSVDFIVTLDASSGRIALTMQQAGAKGSGYISIEEDCVVKVKLVGDQLFFSKPYDAITTKDDLKFFYGGLCYEDYDEKLDRYKTVAFTARYNACGKVGTNHPFSINIDLLQTDAEGNPSWIGMTIDPDIRNPPPV